MATLNFTGRQEIDRSKVDLYVRDDGEKIVLDVVQLQLDDLDVPPSSEVTIEAYLQNKKERISCGTVGKIDLPHDIHLDSFESGEAFRLRLRVIGREASAHGRVLAVADHLEVRRDEEQETQPLLKLQRTDLEELVWEFGEDNGPLLYVNKRLQDHDSLINSAHFKALILPEFVRRVAIWVADNIDDSSDQSSTVSQWLVFFDNIGVELDALDEFNRDELSYRNEVETWAKDVASAFASYMRSVTLLNAGVGDDGWEFEE